MSRAKKPDDVAHLLEEKARQLRIWAENLRIVWRQLPALPDPETDPDTYQRLAIDRERILSQQRANANRLLGEARKLGAFSKGNQEFAEGDFATLVYHWLPSVGVNLSPHPFGRAAIGLGLAYSDYLEALADKIQPQRTSDEKPDEVPATLLSPDRFPGNDPQSEHPQVPDRDPDMEARDNWLNKQAEQCKPWKEFVSKLNKRKPSWRTITTVQGVKQAVAKWRKRNGRTPLPPRRPGRPSKQG